MKRKAKSQATHSGLAVVNPNAAAIDIGATMHVAAVALTRIRPGSQFGTFTADLHRLADWFAECGSRRSSWNRPASTGSRFLNCSTSAALR